MARARSNKVVQWTLAYLALAFTVLEGAEILGSALGWSQGFLRFLTLSLIVAVPVVVVIAWYHGARGLQRVSGTELTILTVLLALGGAFLWREGRIEPTAASPAETAPQAELGSSAAATPVPRESIAVLPFADLSAARDQGYFSDGIAEEILNVLAHVDGLKVASRTSAFQFRNPEVALPDIARQLGVHYILEGSVRKSGETVRVTAQLIDAPADRHLWSETYDRPLTTTNLFGIQDEIANSIVGQLTAAIGAQANLASPEAVKTVTENLDAYELYLKGRSLFIGRTTENLREAALVLREAVRKDPEFARAWEMLAAVFSISPYWGLREESDYLKSALDAADTALRLDPGLSLAYAVRGAVHEFKITRGGTAGWDTVLADYSQAIKNDPQNATVFAWRAGTYETLGFHERSASDARRCLDIDPAYELCRRFLAIAYAGLGRTEDALRHYDLGLKNGYVLSDARFAPIYLASGDRQRALGTLAQQYRDTPQLIQPLFRALTDPAFGDRDRTAALGLVDEFARRADAQIYSLWFLKAYERLVDIEVDTPAVLWAREDLGWFASPARKAMIRRWRLPEYWEEHGFPPQCRRSAETDFECV